MRNILQIQESSCFRFKNFNVDERKNFIRTHKCNMRATLDILEIFHSLWFVWKCFFQLGFRACFSFWNALIFSTILSPFYFFGFKFLICLYVRMHVMPCIHISNGINLKWSQFIYVNRSKCNYIKTVSNVEKDAIFFTHKHAYHLFSPTRDPVARPRKGKQN